MGLNTIQGEVVYDVRGILGVYDEHIFWADGRIYMIRELDPEPAFKVDGQYINVGMAWSICENDGPMTLDLIITREILPLDCSREVGQRAQADRNKLVCGKSHHDDIKKKNQDPLICIAPILQEFVRLYIPVWN